MAQYRPPEFPLEIPLPEITPELPARAPVRPTVIKETPPTTLTPGVSQRQAIFPRVSLPETIGPEFYEQQQRIRSQEDSIHQMGRGIDDLEEQSRLAGYLQRVQESTPPPVDPLLMAPTLDSTEHKLNTIPALLGGDLGATAAIMGGDPTTVLDLPPDDPTTVLQKGLVNWARGVADEAHRVGIDPVELSGQVMDMGPARIQRFADAVLDRDPQAAVGPPPEIASPSMSKGRPVSIQDFASPIRTLEPADLRTQPEQLAPTPEEFEADPRGAAVRTQQVLQHLGSARSYMAGSLLLPPEGADLVRAGMMPELPVTVDEEGRLFVGRQMPDFSTGEIASDQWEVPHGAGVDIGLDPESTQAIFSKAKFLPSKASPAVLSFDPKTRQFSVDRSATGSEPALSIRAALKHAADHEASDGFVSPLRDPVEFAKALDGFETGDPKDYNGVLQNAERMVEEYKGKMGDALREANLRSMPDDPPVVKAYDRAEVAREYFSMGTLAELNRLVAHLKDEESKVDYAAMFPGSPILASTKGVTETLSPEQIRSLFYTAPKAQKHLGKPWQRLAHVEALLPQLDTLRILGAAMDDPIVDWENPENSKRVLDRLLEVYLPALRARMKRPPDESGLGWYQDFENVVLPALREMYGDLMTPVEEDLFTVLIGITSNQTEVRTNFSSAMHALTELMATGEAPEYGPFVGQKSATAAAPSLWGWGSIADGIMSGGMVRLNGLRRTLGSWEAVRNWLFAEHELGPGVFREGDRDTLRGMEGLLKRQNLWSHGDTSGERRSAIKTADITEARPYGTLLFGPKVGRFAANLQGKREVLTIDRHIARAFLVAMGTQDYKTRPGKGGSDEAVVVNVTRPMREPLEKAIGTIAKRLKVQPAEAQAMLWYEFKEMLAQAGGDPIRRVTYGDTVRAYQRSLETPSAAGRDEASTGGLRDPSPGLPLAYDPGALRPDAGRGGLGGPGAGDLGFDTLLAYTRQHGGGTFSRTTLQPVRRTSGFQIAYHPNDFDILPIPLDEVTPERLASELNKIPSDAETIGTWIDKGRLYFEPTVYVRNREAAVRLAKENNQISILDWSKVDDPDKRFVETGGSGERETQEARRARRQAGRMVESAFTAAREYTGNTYTSVAPTLDPEAAKRVADAYDAMKHDPENPEVQRAYGALKREVKDQFDFMAKRIEVEFVDTDPYPNSDAMKKDVAAGRLRVLKTTPGSIPPDHPLAEVDPETGQPYNDLFRAVHDYFGHAASGHSFGSRGEEGAWASHAQMFSPEALPAMTTETKGQNSWVNFGAHLRSPEGRIPQRGEPDYVPPPARPFAPQKAGILPNWELLALARYNAKNFEIDYHADPVPLREPQAEVEADIQSAAVALPHEPLTPEVVESYEALKTTIASMWATLVHNGYSIETVSQPVYSHPDEALDDLRAKRIQIFSGARRTPLLPDHPLAERFDMPGIEAEQDLSDTFSWDDLFQIAFLAFGHGVHGYALDEPGVRQASIEFMRLLPSAAEGAFLHEVLGRSGTANISPPELVSRFRQAYDTFLPTNAPPVPPPSPDVLFSAVQTALIGSNRGFFTFHLTGQPTPPVGFLVGPAPVEGRSAIMSESEFNPGALASYLAKNQSALSHPHVFTRVSQGDGLVILQPAEWVTGSEQQATDLASRRGLSVITDAVSGAPVVPGLGPIAHEAAVLSADPERAAKIEVATELVDAMGRVQPDPLAEGRLRPAGQILGLSFDPEKMKAPKYTDIVGRPVQSAYDVAAIATETMRSPLRETGLVVVVDRSRQEVAQITAVTMGSAFFTSFVTPSLVPGEGGLSYFERTFKPIIDAAEKKVGHRNLEVAVIHNHPSGNAWPSGLAMDIETEEGGKGTRITPHPERGLQDAGDTGVANLLHSVFKDTFNLPLHFFVIDFNFFTEITEDGRVVDYPITTATPEDPFFVTPDVPHPQINDRILQPADMKNFFGGEYTELIKGLDPQRTATVVYADAVGRVRLIEGLPLEKLMQVGGPGLQILDNGKRVGAHRAFVYYPDIAALPKVAQQNLSKLFLSGYVSDVVSAGGTGSEMQKAALKNPDTYMMARQSYQQKWLSMAVPFRVAEPTDPSSDLRVQALAAAASGGFKGAEGKALFASLTDDERYLFVKRRLEDPALTVYTDRHLQSLNPARWAEQNRYPAYFGDWRPTPQQTEVLQAAWKERSERFATEQKTRARLEGAALKRKRARSPKARVPEVVVPDFKLNELLSLQPETLNKMADEQPWTFHLWAMKLLGVAESSRQEIKDTIQGEARQAAMRHLDSLVAAVQGIVTEKSEEPVAPPPKGAYGLITMSLLNGRSNIRTATTVLRLMSRPPYVLGNIKQGDHPLDIKEDLESGRYQRSVFHDLWGGDIRRHQMILDTFNQFGDLIRAVQLDNAAGRKGNLSRKIFEALRFKLWLTPEVFDKPEWKVKVKSKLGREQTVDLKTQIPKLAKWYEDTIGKLEQAQLYNLRYEAARSMSEAQWLEGEIRAREYQEALGGYNDGRTWTGPDWDEIPTDLRKEVQARLRKGKPRNTSPDLDPNRQIYRNGIPYSPVRDQYRALRGSQGSLMGRARAKLAEIQAIKDGSLRREGYVTYLHRLTFDDLKFNLGNPYSTQSRYVNPEVRNRFLSPRVSRTEPVPDWLEGFALYVPSAAKAIHMQGAITRSLARLSTIPESMQTYLLHWIRRFKGIEPQWDTMLNRAVLEDTLRQPGGMDKLMKAATGGRLDTVKMTETADAAGQLDRRPFQRLMRSLAAGAYYGLLGPLRVAALNATEIPFIIQELGKRPHVDLPMGVLWTAKSMLRAGIEQPREILSWLRSTLAGGAPPWYSEATRMGVVDAAASMFDDWQDYGSAGPVKKFGELWAQPIKQTEWFLRAYTYYTLLERMRFYDVPPEIATLEAAKQTNYLIGAYGARDTSPIARGAFWNPWFVFKRFMWGKTEQFFTDTRGAMNFGARAMGNAGRRLQGLEPKSWKPDAGGGSRLPPNLPPPDAPGFMDDDIPPDEVPNLQSVWKDVNVPAAEYGAGFPYARTYRHASRLLFSLGSIAGMMAIASLLHLNDDTDIAWNRMNPYDMSNLGEITPLFWFKDIFRLFGPGGLLMKRYLYGLNGAEVKEMDYRFHRLKYFVPYAGAMLKHHDAKMRELKDLNDFWKRGQMEKLLKTVMRPGGGSPNSEQIVAPGLGYSVYDSLRRQLKGNQAPPPYPGMP